MRLPSTIPEMRPMVSRRTAGVCLWTGARPAVATSRSRSPKFVRPLRRRSVDARVERFAVARVPRPVAVHVRLLVVVEGPRGIEHVGTIVRRVGDAVAVGRRGAVGVRVVVGDARRLARGALIFAEEEWVDGLHRRLDGREGHRGHVDAHLHSQPLRSSAPGLRPRCSRGASNARGRKPARFYSIWRPFTL